MAQMTELISKDIQTTLINMLPMFKNVAETVIRTGMEDFFKTQIEF